MKRRLYGKRICCCLLSGLVALTTAVSAHADDEVLTPPYYDTITITQGTLNIDAKVYVRKGPGKDYGRLGRLAPGEVFTITGQEKDWYQIEFEGGIGYVLAELVDTTTYEDQVEHVDEAAFEASISEADYPVVLERKESYSLRGIVHSSLPMTEVTVKVINQMTLAEEMSAGETFNRGSNVMKYDLNELDDYLKFRKLPSGEKRLLVTIKSGSATADVLDVVFYVTGATDDEPVSMTDACTFEMRDGRAQSLMDGKYDSAWKPQSDTDQLTIKLPTNRTAGLITLEWTKAVRNYSLACYNQAGELVENIEATYAYDMFATGHTLAEGVTRLLLTTNNLDTALAEVRVYEADKISGMVPRWSESNKKVDLMVIGAHQGDELLYFGGLIPSAVGAGRNVEMIYLSDKDRERQSESLEAMWTAGLTNAPVYLGFREERTDDYEEAVGKWDLEIAVEKLVERIRATQPDVVVTHNVSGEEGDHQHGYTATLVRRAVLLAADETSYPTSYAKYGAWDVKKLYIHQYEANTVTLDYTQPLEQFGSLTAQQMTERAFGRYGSLAKKDLSDYNEEFAANSYGLIFSSVGEDIEKTDLFEHIDG